MPNLHCSFSLSLSLSFFQIRRTKVFFSLNNPLSRERIRYDHLTSTVFKEEERERSHLSLSLSLSLSSWRRRRHSLLLSLFFFSSFFFFFSKRFPGNLETKNKMTVWETKSRRIRRIGSPRKMRRRRRRERSENSILKRLIFKLFSFQLSASKKKKSEERVTPEKRRKTKSKTKGKERLLKVFPSFFL